MAMVFLDQPPPRRTFHRRHRIMSTHSQTTRKQQVFQKKIARSRLHRSTDFHSGNHQPSSCSGMGRCSLPVDESGYHQSFMHIHSAHASLGILSDPSRRESDYPYSTNLATYITILLDLFVLLRFLYSSLVLLTIVLSSSQR